MVRERPPRDHSHAGKVRARKDSSVTEESFVIARTETSLPAARSPRPSTVVSPTPTPTPTRAPTPCARGRLYLVSGTAQAIAESCLECQRDFLRRRSVNGRRLDQYPAIQDLVAKSVADVFAMDTVTRW
jgi:hypothetical protein